MIGWGTTSTLTPPFQPPPVHTRAACVWVGGLPGKCYLDQIKPECLLASSPRPWKGGDGVEEGKKKQRGGGMDKDPLLSQMLDACTFITMETKAPPCRLSRRWQRGWELVSAYPASNGGRGREKGTPPHPSPLEHPPLSSGLCWEAGIGFLAGTILGAGGHGWAFPQPYSLAPLRIWTPWAGGATGLGDSLGTA